MNDSPTMITIEMDSEKVSVPVVYKKSITETSYTMTAVKSSKTWYQTMSLSTVVGYKGFMYKLRLPYVKTRLNKRVKIQLNEGVREAMVPGYFKEVGYNEGSYILQVRSADNRWEYRKKTTADGNANYDYIPPRRDSRTKNISYPGILNYSIVRLAYGDQIKYDKQSKTYEADQIVKTMVKSDIDTSAKVISRKFLNADYKAKRDAAKNAYNLAKLKETETMTSKQTKNIGLDCFAFELVADNYIVFIAGNWYITFSNPNKFFTEDYRLADKQIIAETIIKLKKEFYVRKKDVDALILEVYAEERMFNDTRLILLNETKQTFFSFNDILDIIKKKVLKNRHTVMDTDASRALIVKNIERKMKLSFYKYVTLHPVWDTEERFQQCIIDMGLQGSNDKKFITDKAFWDIVYRYFDTVTNTDVSQLQKGADLFGGLSDDEDDSLREFQLLTYNQLMDISDRTRKEVLSIVASRELPNIDKDDKDMYKKVNPQDHVQSYLIDLLKKMNISNEDNKDILMMFTDKLKTNGRFRIKDLQKAMVNISKVNQGKYGLFRKLVEGTGVKTDDKDLTERINKEIMELKKQLKIETGKLDTLANQISKLADERTAMGNVGDAEDQDAAADIQTARMNTLNKEIADKRNLLEKLSPGGKDNKTISLNRQLYAMLDTDWVLMKDSLEKAGVKAVNKRAQKLNIIMSLEEFMDMISKFSCNLDKGELTEELQNLQREGNQNDINNIMSRLSILSEKNHSDDFKTMISAAKYIFERVSNNSVLETIRDLCKVCSYDNYDNFVDYMESVNQGNDSDWFEVQKNGEKRNYSLRKAHKFLEVMAILHYTTEYMDQNEIKMKSTTRTNGIPFALRYDFFRSGVNYTKLNENTFVNMKTGKDATFLFPSGKRIGLYDKTEETFTPPENTRDYATFHVSAKKIIEIPDADFDYQREKKSKQKPRKERSRNKEPMELIMSKYNLQRRNDTATDGNCFFDALRITMGLEQTTYQIRQTIVDKLWGIITQNPTDPINEMIQMRRGRSFILLERDDQNYETKLNSYIADMRRNGTWADQAIVQTAVAVYRRPIYIINDNSPPNTCVQIVRKLEGWDLPNYELDNFIVIGNATDLHYYGTKQLEGFENGKLMSLYFREKMRYRLFNGPTYMSPSSTQDGATCAIHALNNLNIGTYDRQDLEQIRGKIDWWGTREAMIALGASVKLDEFGVRMDGNDTYVAYEVLISAKELWQKRPEEFLNAGGLMGVLFFFPPTTKGHWTAMRVESVSGTKVFTYSDSLRPGNDPDVTNPALTTSFYTAAGAVQYLSESEDTTYGGKRWDTAIMVFQTLKDRKNFASKFGSRASRRASRKIDLTEEANDKEELIKEYAAIISEQSGNSLSFDTMSDKLKNGIWKKIQKLFKKYARHSKRKHPDRFTELPDFNVILPLENKKWILRTFVVWTASKN